MSRSNAVMQRTSIGSGRNAIHKWDSRDGKHSLTLDMKKVSDEMASLIMDHGAFAKIGDAAAQSDATTAEKFERMEAVRDNIYAGNWNGGRESHQDLLAAILESDPTLDRKKVSADLKTMSDVERKTLRAHPPIKKILDKMAADAVKRSGIDSAALLAKFK